MGSWLSADELREDMDPGIYDQVTRGDGSLGDWAISRAETWFTAYLRRNGVTLTDEMIPAVKQIISKRAQYELYARQEVEEMARDKRQDANELVRALLGDDPEGQTEAQRPAGAVKVPDYDGIDWSKF